MGGFTDHGYRSFQPGDSFNLRAIYAVHILFMRHRVDHKEVEILNEKVTTSILIYNIKKCT